MPKILSYTPPWLLRPSPGFNCFSTESQSENGYFSSERRPPALGPRRRIAKRGTDIFVARGKEIRWADLSHLKDDWEDSEDLHPSRARSKQRQRSESDSTEEGEEGEEGARASFRVRMLLKGL
jgi:nucleoporin NUP82